MLNAAAATHASQEQSQPTPTLSLLVLRGASAGSHLRSVGKCGNPSRGRYACSELIQPGSQLDVGMASASTVPTRLQPDTPPANNPARGLPLS
jgi:hypothetical protein